MTLLRPSVLFAATMLRSLELTLQKDMLTARTAFYIMARAAASLFRELGHAIGWRDFTSAISSNWSST